MLRGLTSLVLGAAMMFESWGYMMPHQDPTDMLILVNKDHKAPAIPVSLVKPDVPPTRDVFSENIYMRPEAAHALEDMFDAAAKEGLTLYATSGFRSYATQKAIFDRKLKKMSEKKANEIVAKPGYSEHQSGLTMDIEGKTTLNTGLTYEFGESPEGLWVKENCHTFGFIIRYPEDKTDITGYTYEPWHLRYVGTDAAKVIYEQDATLEEYLQMLRSSRIQQMKGEEP